MEASEVPSGLMPQLRLDELLAEVQVRLQALVETRDRMHGLLEAVVAIGSGLELGAMLRRIVEAAVELADAEYGALGVIGADQQLTEFIPVGLTGSEIRGIHHWPEGRGLLGLLIKEPRPLRLADIGDARGVVRLPATGTRGCGASSACRSGSATGCSATCT